MTAACGQDRNHRTELLAPAGSIEALEAGFMAGADAVYIGGSRFGARAYADNPDEEALLGAIHLAHRLGKKLYMTVNTLLKDRELEEELISWILPYVNAGLDGVIVQDFGVFSLLSSRFPGLALHASTQMAVTGPAGAAFLKRAGAARVVPARELTLSEIRKIRDKAGIEIEGFAHGAMCYSYSGMCLMSSLIGGRSGNRGRCAGVCRLPFDVFENGTCLTGKNTRYPLNMKDMCTVDILPEMIDAGIRSFKIEGRMKKPEYTAGVVQIYRKYLDLCEKRLAEGHPMLPSGWYHVEEEDRKTLWDIFNRDGFSRGCYTERNGRDLIALKNEKLSQVRAKTAQELTENIRRSLAGKEMRSRLQAPACGNLKLSEETGAELVLSWSDSFGHRAFVRLSGDGVQKAVRAPLTEERVRNQMNKTGESPFFFEKLEICMEDDLFVPMQLLSDLRRRGTDALEKAVRAQFARDFSAETEPAFRGTGREEAEALPSEVTVSVETEEQLGAVLEKAGRVSAVYVPWEFFGYRAEEVKEELRKAEEGGISVRLMLPYVCRHDAEKRLAEAAEAYMRFCSSHGKETEASRGILVRNLEELALMEECGAAPFVILDAGLYTMNSRAEAFFAGRGYRRNTVSLELNAGEMRDRDNTCSEMIVYGRSPMMISAHCLKKTLDRCTKTNARLVLKDRKNAEFPAESHCDLCFSIIYNSLPTSLLGERESLYRAGIRSFRLSFTGESAGECGRILEAFLREAEGKSFTDPVRNATKGHYRRGAE